MTVTTGPIARIRSADGAICGTGFLIGDRHVMTCAHVIDDAIAGRRRGDVGAPDQPVRLDLPFLDRFGIGAGVVAWFPMRPLDALQHDPVADIAVLELGEPVRGGIDSPNALLATPHTGTAFLTYGFPRGMDNGTQATGELLMKDAGGWRQVRDLQNLGYFVEPGFSGAPVFAVDDGKLLGMVVAADLDATKRLAFAIPTPTLCRAWPLLAKPYKELFRLHRGGRRTVLRPRAVRRGTPCQGRRALVPDGDRPFRLGQVLGGHGGAGAAAAQLGRLGNRPVPSGDAAALPAGPCHRGADRGGDRHCGEHRASGDRARGSA